MAATSSSGARRKTLAVSEKEIVKTQQQLVQEEALKQLAIVGGMLTTEEDVIKKGDKFVLPERLSDDEAIAFLVQRRDDNEHVHRFSRTFPYRPMDGARATKNAIIEAFGFTMGKTIVTFFGKEPPEFVDVSVGPRGETEQVPWGAMKLPTLENTTVHLSSAKDKDLGQVFQIVVDAPRKYRYHIEGLFRLIARNLAESSIYRGRAIDGSMNFIDLSNIDPEAVVYTGDVQRQLNANIWSRIRYAAQLEKLNQPGKRTALLEGPYGTGKTLAGGLTAQIAEDNGWTAILAGPDDDLHTVIQTARMYQPCVVFFEDIDRVSKAGQPGIEQILDTMDGLKVKGLKLIAVMTTNHAEEIHKGMVRPGRLDSVIHIGSMDRDGYEYLVRQVVGDSLDKDVDFDAAFAANDGYVPAFVREALDRAVGYSVAENDGVLGPIGTTELVLSANGLRDQLKLMEGASDRPPTDTMSDALARVVDERLENVGMWNTGVRDDNRGEPAYELGIRGN